MDVVHTHFPPCIAKAQLKGGKPKSCYDGEYEMGLWCGERENPDGRVKRRRGMTVKVSRPCTWESGSLLTVP